MATREFDRFPARQSFQQVTDKRRLACVRRQAADSDDDGTVIVHELTDDSRMRTSCSMPEASSRSNRESFGLSRSSTPISLDPFSNGTTISEFEALSQAMWPGNSCTFGTITVSAFAAAVPHTP